MQTIKHDKTAEYKTTPSDMVEEERIRRRLGLDVLKNEIEYRKERYSHPHAESVSPLESVMKAVKNQRQPELEEKSGMSLPEPPTLPLPPLFETIKEKVDEKIKDLSKRALFR